MKKITILALHLGAGGIERAITMLANSICNEYNVEIVSTYKLYDKPFFELSDKVKVTYLLPDLKPNKKEIKVALKKKKIITFIKESKKACVILYERKKMMINYIKNCNSDIIISTRDIHNEWLGKYAKKGIVKIGWEHNHHNNDNKYINKIVNSVKGLDYFILVSKELYEFYDNKVNPKCIYIPNSIDYFPKKLSSLKGKNIISVGRISKEKGFLDLVDVFERVHQIYPDWFLNIVGDGPEYDLLNNKIKNKGLDKSIILHGYQNRQYINELLKSSSIYVMTSYTESFGIVLLEAFAYGIPCIAFDSAKGAKEIIKDNWNGYLIANRDFEKMAKRICELIKSPERRMIMGDYGYKKAQEYDVNSIKELWIKLFANCKK